MQVQQTQQVPCFILHRRPFRETSAIIDVVAQGYGRIHMIIKGVQNQKQSKKKSQLSALAQVFRPLLLSFGGQGELKTVFSIEDNGPALNLNDKFLYSGFYINELICRLWPQNIESQQLYQQYLQTLTDLLDVQQLPQSNQMILEMVLRRFEFNLLTMLGYGIDCFATFDNQQPIEPQGSYKYETGQGFVEIVLAPNQHSSRQVFSGADILAIGEMDLTSVKVLKSAKLLVRLALAPYLGQKPLKSRELFSTLVL